MTLARLSVGFCDFVQYSASMENVNPAGFGSKMMDLLKAKLQFSQGPLTAELCD